MYASLLHLNAQDMARLRITDTYSLHRVVYDLFEPVRDSAEQQESSGILFVDKGIQRAVREILIISNRLPRGAVHGQLDTKEIPENLLRFSTYRFEIVINPVKRDNASGKIVPLRTREAVQEWFIAKAPGWGFEPEQENMEVHDLSVLQFEKKGQPVTLGQARLTGTLHVRDAKAFSLSFTHGIGRGKAFGCGLLQIIPVV